MRRVLWTLALLVGAAAAATPARAADSVADRLTRSTVEMPVSTPCAAPDRVYQAASARPMEAPRQRWRGMVGAYGWMTNLKGTSYAKGEEPVDVDIPFSDIFDRLDYVFQGYVEVGYGRWSLAIDGTFLGVSEEFSDVQRYDVKVSLDEVLLDVRLGYTVLCRKVGSSQWGSCCYPRFYTLDAIVGARFWDASQTIEARPVTGGPSQENEESTSWIDPYVGVRARWQFAKRWGLAVYGDVGGFDIADASSLTWQIQAHLSFNITRHLILTAGYRVLDVDRVDGSGLDREGLDMRMHGPVLGIGWIF